MKKIILIIISLIFVIIIAPYFIGSSAEAEIRQQAAKINNHPSFQMTIVNYDKQWFSSKAEIELSIFLSEEILPLKSLNKIKVFQEIQHGPILWQGRGLTVGLMDAEILVELAKAYSENTKKVEGLNEKVFSITSRTGFDLTTSIDLVLTDFSIKEGLNTLNVKSGSAYFNYDNASHIEGVLNWQGLTASIEGKETIQLGTVTIDSKQELISGELLSPSALFSGYLNTKISLIKLNGYSTAQNFSLQDFHLKLISEIKDNLADVSFMIDVKKLFALNQEFNQLHYDMSLNNLDVESLKKINDISLNSQHQSAMLMAAQIQGILPQLIEKGPVLKINQLAVITKDGKINSDLVINIDNSIYDAKNPMTMMLALAAEAKGQGPEAFFNEITSADSIESLVQQNLLIRDQQSLKFKFSFNNGQALLNGLPIPLAGR